MKARPMTDPDELLSFWNDEVGPKGWYAGGDALDTKIRQRFEPTWRMARRQGEIGWSDTPRHMLALIILLDQFPRNMFRGKPEAFSTDKLALSYAKRALNHRWDNRVTGPIQHFFYLPLTHSECLCDQERSVRLVMDRVGNSEQLIHARAHREIIRQFGRFPTRNEDLGRRSTPVEDAYIAAGGYRTVVDSLRKAA